MSERDRRLPHGALDPEPRVLHRQPPEGVILPLKHPWANSEKEVACRKKSCNVYGPVKYTLRVVSSEAALFMHADELCSARSIRLKLDLCFGEEVIKDCPTRFIRPVNSLELALSLLLFCSF